MTKAAPPPAFAPVLDSTLEQAVPPEVREWGMSRMGADPAWCIDYFVRFFHRPLSCVLPLEQRTAIECASGFGCNALAYVLAGGHSIVGYDRSRQRIEFAVELADRLGLGHRARFEVSDIHSLPRFQADVVFSLQTLEHVPRPLEALRALADRARAALVLSTPNHLFPVDGHDTGLLFAHWLPRGWRKRYAELRGAPSQQLSRLLTPTAIDRALADFERVTRAYNFQSIHDWLAQFPCFFPYGGGGGRWLPARSLRQRWRAASMAFSILGPSAMTLAPVIEGIWVRRDGATRAMHE